jgi:hypothetical protein
VDGGDEKRRVRKSKGKERGWRRERKKKDDEEIKRNLSSRSPGWRRHKGENGLY